VEIPWFKEKKNKASYGSSQSYLWIKDKIAGVYSLNQEQQILFMPLSQITGFALPEKMGCKKQETIMSRVNRHKHRLLKKRKEFDEHHYPEMSALSEIRGITIWTTNTMVSVYNGRKFKIMAINRDFGQQQYKKYS